MSIVRRRRADLRRPRAAGRRLDDRVLRWLADTPHGPLGPVLKGVARTADLLLPWAALSAGWLRGGQQRLHRATARGWTAVALAAVVEDGIVKPATGRSRPATRRLPRRQRHDSRPSTSAFPSGHAGAATAFAVAAGADAPGWRPLLVTVAAVTTYSLVYTGRHYPTDAVAGVVIGAAAGTVVRRLPGLRPV